MSWKPEPDVHVFCLCGAQWHGKYAVGNPVIIQHRHRRGCGFITHQRFKALGFADKRSRIAVRKVATNERKRIEHEAREAQSRLVGPTLKAAADRYRAGEGR